MDAALVSGGEVRFDCGPEPTTIYLTRVKAVTAATKIVAEPARPITLNGNGTTRLFEVAHGTSLTLRSVTLAQAYIGFENGGAIMNHGDLVLLQVTIRASTVAAAYSGGALFSDGTVTIDGSTFDSNSAGNGGAIHAVSRLRMYASTMRGNAALNAETGYGGAVLASGDADLTIVDTGFFENSARAGAALATSDKAVVAMLGNPTEGAHPSALQFTRNHAELDGGAIFHNGARLQITNGEFAVNTVRDDTSLVGYGGAIWSASTLRLLDSKLYNNHGRFGGAVFLGTPVSGDTVTEIRRAVLHKNGASRNGGGLYTNSVHQKVEIFDSTFDENTAGEAGGGLARFDAALRVERCSFALNRAGTVGGGLHLAAQQGNPSPLSVKLGSSTISDNISDRSRGGGVANEGALADMSDLTIAVNTNGLYTAANGQSRLRNTVLDNGPDYLNCDSDGTAVVDLGFNVSSDSSCVLPISRVAVPAQLGALLFDAASKLYFREPLPGSSLIDTGGQCPSRDQLGGARVAACDVGAVEYGN